MTATDQPKLTFLGHSTVRCDLPDGRVILIDPFLRENPSCPEHLETLERLDAILITHGHFDHFADTIALAKAHRLEKIVATYEICRWLTLQGIECCSPMNPGGTQDVLGLQVTQVPAVHTSSIEHEGQIIYGGVATGFVVRAPGGFTFYHAGDTALFSDMKLIAELYAPDLAFLPIGDLFTMGPREAAHACRFLAVKNVVPLHYGTWPVLTGTPDQLRDSLADLGVACTVHPLDPGQSYVP